MPNINDIIKSVKESNSWDEFKAKVINLSPDKENSIGLKVDNEPLPKELSDFNKSLQKGLNFDPKKNNR